MNPKYNFDKIIDRKGTGALKTDRLKERFGRDDLLAAWVADMDFETPPFIVEALKRRLEHPVFGYGVEPEDYRPLIVKWEKELHGWDIKPEWISYIPGIVKGIGMAINVFTKPGDNVYIMPPVYHPFKMTIENNGRKVKEIPLIEDSERIFKIDFNKLENIAVGGLLLFSHPHNPGGRIWEKEELQHLASLCKEKGIIVISDEIHADMALWNKKFTPYAMVSREAALNSITFCAPSKVFNIPGIVSSFSIIENNDIRNKFYSWLKANELNEAPEFSYLATCAAYRHGKEWRLQMLDYIEENIKFTSDYFKKEIPGIKTIIPEASFLVWLDCRDLRLPQKKLVDLFVNHAKVALNDGAMFGKEGEGFMRLNVGMPRSELEKILKRIKKGVETYFKEK